MPKVLQWGLLVILAGALIASLAYASLTINVFRDRSREPQNYLGNRYALGGADQAGRFALSASTIPHSTIATISSTSPDT